MARGEPGRDVRAPFLGLALAGLLVLGQGLLAPGLLPAASAAACADSDGVSVVVDQRELGGGVLTACVPDGGGRSAASVFAAAGVSLSYATRQPGFVCRVNGAPASDPCVNTSPPEAYWGLWWADGASSTWTYSAQGVGGLVVPDGGSVAWSWQQDRATSGPVPPTVGPAVHRPSSPSPTPSPTASPSPTKTPTQTPSPTPSQTPAPTPSESSTAPGSTPAATPAPSSTSGPSPGKTPGKTPSKTPIRTPTPSASPSPTATGSDSAAPAPTEEPPSAATGAEDAAGPSRVPGWVTWGVLGLLAAAAAASAVVARRRRGA